MKKEICGVVLAGGNGTRLQPATLIQNKHLLPVLNIPMIMFPLNTMINDLGVTDICIVTGGNQVGKFADFLGNGNRLGVDITYKVQEDAGGIAQALALTEDFVGDRNVVVILGDNVFEHVDKNILDNFEQNKATILCKQVADNKRFGVPTVDAAGNVSKITEKPEHPESDMAVTGLYLYTPDVFEKISTLVPSARGELEITDVNNLYINEGRLNSYVLNPYRAFWHDCGTPYSIYATSEFLMTENTDLLDKVENLSFKLA